MTKKKSIFDHIREEMEKTWEKREIIEKERKKKRRKERDSFYYELYRDWGKYETDNKYHYEYEDGKSKDDFRENLKSVLKYWIKNEVKSEDDFNCRSVVVIIWKKVTLRYNYNYSN